MSSSSLSPSEALDEPTFAAQIIREFRASTSKRDFNGKREEKHNVAKRLKFENNKNSETDNSTLYDESKALMRAQLAGLKAEKAKLESHVINMERALKKERSEKNELEAQMKRTSEDHDEVVGELKHQIEKLVREQDDRWSHESQDLKEEVAHRREVDKANLKLREELNAIRESREELASQLEYEKGEKKSLVNDLKFKLKVNDIEIEKYRRIEEKYKEGIKELNTLRTKLNECESKLSEATHVNRALKEREKEGEESLRVHKVFQSQVDELPRLREKANHLQKENNLLIAAMERSEAMTEENEHLRRQVDKLEALVEEGSKYKFDVEHLNKSLRQWQDLCMRLFKEDKDKENMDDRKDYSVDHLARKLGQWQREHLTLRAELRAVHDELRSEQARCKELEASLETSVTSLRKLEQEGSEEKELLKKMHRRITLLMKERDSYKSVLDSYENEVTFSASQFQKDKIRSLETVLQQQTDFISSHLGINKTGLMGDTERMSPEVESSALKNRVKELEEERDRLRAQMSERALRGDFDPLETKVIHMRSNPVSDAVEQRERKVETLQEENDRLRTRLQLIEQGCSSSNANKEISLLVEQKMKEMPSSAEHQDLKERLRLADLRRDRLVEAFKKTSKDFRTACLQLLGYRVDGLANRQYRLTPVYSESQGDHLLFQMDSDANFTLLETPFSKSVRDLVSLHLERQHSIPVFLAAIVIDQFSKQSFATNETTLSSHQDSQTIVQGQSGQDEDPICID